MPLIELSDLLPRAILGAVRLSKLHDLVSSLYIQHASIGFQSSETELCYADHLIVLSLSIIGPLLKLR